MSVVAEPVEKKIASKCRPRTLKSRAADIINAEMRFIYVDEFESLGSDDAVMRDIEELISKLQLEALGSGAEEESVFADSEEPVSPRNWSSPDPLLTFEQEQRLFRALNFLRYRVDALRNKLSPSKPARARVEKLEVMLDLVEQIRSQLVQSNLRLVASIARRFSTSGTDVDDFSSDGCMILLGAIDRFDYSRGFRFSTYATHSIQRHFFRAWKVRQRRRERFPNTPSEILTEVAGVQEEEPLCTNPERVVSDLLTRADEVLDHREHKILLHRYGLGSANERSRTLREIAADLGISKERVRQLQMKAIEKLRDVLPRDLAAVLSPTYS